MKRTVFLDGRPRELEFRQEGDRCRFRLGNGEEREASVRVVQPGIYSVLLGGRSFDVKLIPAPDGFYLDVAGRHLAARVVDTREAAAGAGAGALDHRRDLAAPMPGRVVRVLVAEGDSVAAGQGLVVVEAMKMQNEIRAPREGRVARVNAREGDAVAAGQVLVTID